MNPRHAHALAHPLNGHEPDIDPYRTVDPQRDGKLLQLILAVDR